MFRRDEVTSQVQVIEVFSGEPVQITLRQRVARPDGKERTLTQKVSVPDCCLAERFLLEAHPGDVVEATIVTEWSKTGYVTYLSDFCLLVRREPLVQSVKSLSREG